MHAFMKFELLNIYKITYLQILNPSKISHNMVKLCVIEKGENKIFTNERW